MPVTTRKNDATKRLSLVDDLASVLRSAQPNARQPLISENQIAQTKSVHVAVIWDKWKDLSPTERSEVILNACTRAGRFRNSTITLAMGLTGEEALRRGFLPYSIVIMRRQGRSPSRDQMEKAMAGAGGISMKVGSSTQLRFASFEQAEEAYRHLSQAVPGPYWAIVHEESTGE